MTCVQWIVSALLGIIGLFRVVMPDPVSNVVHPLGPKMCDRLCSHRIGCSGYLYRPLDLSCRLVVGKSKSGQLSPKSAYNYQIFKGTQTVHENDNLTCLRNSKIFRTRRRIMKCRHIQKRRSGLGKYTRLLILPRTTGNNEALQFYLGNKSVTTYPYTQDKWAEEVAYVAFKKKLLIYSASPSKLFFVSLDGKKKTEICRGKYVSGIAVDDEKQLVFLTSESPNGIYVMTRGTNYTLLKNLKGSLGNIAIDSQKQLIYTVVLCKRILKLTYEGVSQGIIVKGHISSAMALNSNGSVLYYFKQEHIYILFKLNLANGIPSEIPTPFKPYPQAMYVFSNKLYLTPDNNRPKLSVVTDSGKQIRLIDTGYGSYIRNCIVCAIP